MLPGSGELRTDREQAKNHYQNQISNTKLRTGPTNGKKRLPGTAYMWWCPRYASRSENDVPEHLSTFVLSLFNFASAVIRKPIKWKNGIFMPVGVLARRLQPFPDRSSGTPEGGREKIALARLSTGRDPPSLWARCRLRFVMCLSLLEQP